MLQALQLPKIVIMENLKLAPESMKFINEQMNFLKEKFPNMNEEVLSFDNMVRLLFFYARQQRIVNFVKKRISYPQFVVVHCRIFGKWPPGWLLNFHPSLP